MESQEKQPPTGERVSIWTGRTALGLAVMILVAVLLLVAIRYFLL